jgi:hypothetical protein
MGVTTNLSHTNLTQADLIYVNLSKAILLHIDLRNTKGLTQEQLEGTYPPLLCNVALPKGITGIDPDRDCDKLPQVLLERYPRQFRTLEEAKAFVENSL